MDIALATGVFFQRVWGVDGVILHHYYCLLAALPQFSIHILHGKAWQQGAILCMQSLHHYVKTFSQVRLRGLHRYYMGGKGSNVSTFWVYIKRLSLLVSYPSSWSFPTSTGVILLTAKRCAALAFTQGIAKASISASLIMLTAQPMVGVPRMMGTLVAKLERSGMIRAI